MKRITIVSVFALLTAIGSTGCLGQSSTVEEEVGASEQASRGAYYVAADGEGTAYGAGRPNQSLELNLHPNGEGQGPHPEPWLQQAGPHPEPWQGSTAEPSSGGNGNAEP